MELELFEIIITAIASLITGGAIVEMIRRRTVSKDKQMEFYLQLNKDFIDTRRYYEEVEKSLRDKIDGLIQALRERDKDYMLLAQEHSELKADYEKLKRQLSRLQKRSDK
jgi:hypothetical protein